MNAQQELNGVGQAPLTALNGVHVDIVDVGEVLLNEVGDVGLAVVFIVVLVEDFDLVLVLEVFVAVSVDTVAEHLQALEALYKTKISYGRNTGSRSVVPPLSCTHC